MKPHSVLIKGTMDSNGVGEYREFAVNSEMQINFCRKEFAG